ncbi:MULTISPECIES: DUF6293 family protein [unclassified Archaeoglobus]|uniref:HFX_2341 family transcriptional regulator domain-containing protein n=1 Tax=unclassified Archaeoglobus TaxID=2643606 RepID=UPI0025B95EEC|nr:MULTISPECIES: DUF6293 family protein [unclassified Archaeoglobus]
MITQFVFVGHKKEKLIESIRALREQPISKIILFVGEEELPGESKARRTAEELKKDLETIYDVEIAKIDKRNVIRAAKQLVEMINREKERGKDVLLNASGSLRSVAIAAYIAACVTGSRIVTSIPKYDEKEEEIGIEEIIEVPTLPIDFPGEEQIQILSAVDSGVNSLDELVLKLNPDMEKKSKEFFSERSRLSHHLSKLEKAGFVVRMKRGRNVRIELTPLGRIFSEAMGCQSS